MLKYPSANEFYGSVESFARSNLKIEEIESLVRSMIPENTNVNANANVNVNRPRKGQESFELTKTESGTESKEQKQISIVLDTIFNPNPKLVETYEDAKATDIWFDKNGRPGYINEERIFVGSKG